MFSSSMTKIGATEFSPFENLSFVSKNLFFVLEKNSPEIFDFIQFFENFFIVGLPVIWAQFYKTFFGRKL